MSASDDVFDFGGSSIGLAAMGVGAPLAILGGIVSMFGGRSKRKARRRQAAANLKSRREAALSGSVQVGEQAQLAAGQVIAGGARLGGTVATGLTQSQMANVFIEQQRTLASVGLDRKAMAGARRKALQREAARKARARRNEQFQRPERMATEELEEELQKRRGV